MHLFLVSHIPGKSSYYELHPCTSYINPVHIPWKFHAHSMYIPCTSYINLVHIPWKSHMHPMHISYTSHLRETLRISLLRAQLWADLQGKGWPLFWRGCWHYHSQHDENMISLAKPRLPVGRTWIRLSFVGVDVCNSYSLNVFPTGLWGGSLPSCWNL